MSSSNCQSVCVVGVIFLIALGSMAYIGYFSGVEKEEIIVARIKELDLSLDLKDSASKTESYLNEERRSIIDCENMVPLELQSPRFLGVIPNITASKGDNVSIPCVTENLQTYRMAWLKLHSQTILTIHNHIITKNRRIGLSMDTQTLETPCKNQSMETTILMYTLNIDSISEKDEGFYMCQMNTDPMKGQWGYLKVEIPPTTTTNPSSSSSSSESSSTFSITS